MKNVLKEIAKLTLSSLHNLKKEFFFGCCKNAENPVIHSHLKFCQMQHPNWNLNHGIKKIRSLIGARLDILKKKHL